MVVAVCGTCLLKSLRHDYSCLLTLNVLGHGMIRLYILIGIAIAVITFIYARWVENHNKKVRLIVENAKATHELCQECPKKLSCYALCDKYVQIYGKEVKE